jgi:peroxiredoxin
MGVGLKQATVAGLRILLPVLALLPLAGSADLSGTAAPDFALKSIAGPNLRLSEYRGRVVLLGFWASWCGDCRAALRELEDVRTRYEGAGFELMTVSLDGDDRQARKVAESLDLGFPVLMDAGGTVGEMYEVDAMPYVAMIDRDGIVRAEFEGYRRGDVDAWIEQVRGLLGE